MAENVFYESSMGVYAPMEVERDRLQILDVPHRSVQSFPCAVMEGLSLPQKTLPCRYFYDDVGSQLFEKITGLPEYYLTEAEDAILRASADGIVACMQTPFSIVEFGSGSSAKTRHLISAALQQAGRLDYSPIDISRHFLLESSIGLLSDYEGLTIEAIASEYHDAIDALPHTGLPRLLLFLGSNIGNFEPNSATEFLRLIAQAMLPHDRLLIGIDLVKNPEVIRSAYNDSLGTTAQFNKNILARINRELEGTFDLDAFDHDAPFVHDLARVEMRLISRCSQTVHIRKLDASFEFVPGEFILTETSCKYTADSFGALAAQANLRLVKRWSDREKLFSVLMLERET